MPLALILDARPEPAAAAGRAEPRQTRLYRLLKQTILDGRLAPGAALPGSRQLAADFRMARNCVLFAYQQLVAEGFLEADRGGTRVAALPLAARRRPTDITPNAHPTLPGALSQRARALPAMSADDTPRPFALGVADLNAFPWGTWAKFLQQAWGEVSARQLAYAEPGGEPALRQAVAGFLSARRGVVCSPEQVFIVAGSQVALDACARLLADAGDPVWLENPCYPAARNSMLAAGLRPVHVPVDAHGMAPPPGLWERQPPRLIYLTPSHQYPLGSVLSLERRLEFLQRLQPGVHWLIEDDYDSDFNHAGPQHGPASRPLPAIQGLQPEAPVIYLGTFSKLLYPGLRIAYMVVPRWATAAIGRAISALYRSGQAVEQRALARFMDSGKLVRHLRQMAPVYRERRDVLHAELQRHFGHDSEILGGQAGQHLVLRLPAGPPDTRIVTAARERGVTVRALSGYFAGPAPDNGLVLGYGIAEAGRIPELVRRVRGAFEAAR